MALAIGVIIGGAVGKVVSALVSDILMPPIGLLLPGSAWREAKYILSTTTNAAGETVENAILYGHFMGTLIDFLIIAWVVFLVTKWLLRPDAVTTKACPECLEAIPMAARRCRACSAAMA